MNHELIAEYLANTKNPVQLVKHLDEVPDSKKQWPMALQLKYDGVYTLAVVIDGTAKLYGRTGLKLYWEADSILKERYDPMDGGAVPNPKLHDGVYVGEFCNQMYTLGQLSGLLNPNRKKGWGDDDYNNMMGHSDIYMHDYLTFDELLGGHSERNYMERHKLLSELMFKAGLEYLVVKYDLVFSPEEAQTKVDEFIGTGEEGGVLKALDADWVAGHKGYRAMKIVRGVSLDLRCVGVLFGKGKRAEQIAALEFEFKGNKFKADLGKGWTDERRTGLTDQYKNSYLWNADGSSASPIIGKIWEVKALDISSTGKALRLPKVQRVRWDKEEPDA